jgi:hypothetical protein
LCGSGQYRSSDLNVCGFELHTIEHAGKRSRKQMMMDWGRRGKGKIRRRSGRRRRRNSLRRKTNSRRRSRKGETKKILVSTSYVRRGRSGFRNLVRVRFSVPQHTDPEVHSASYTMGTCSLSRA